MLTQILTKWTKYLLQQNNDEKIEQKEMKKIIIMAAALLLGLQGMNAQTENDENDDIITVTDKDGKSEEIEIPEGMEDNLDSLLHLYNTQTYLMPDTSCN